MSARQMFNVAAGTPMGGGAAVVTFTAPVTGALLLSCAVDTDDTLRMGQVGETPNIFGGGTSLGVNTWRTYVIGVVRDEIYEMSFATGVGNVEKLLGVIETDQVA